ncbi:type II toxin-antitoxin system Phd/YefM family antitoxin [Marinomonas transparens]|uniref:Antitoxin n=1 Tax=Marinomonas transparens TaxID=2795388 RepID=A0A934JXB0_9GAMM|nr:type II toxin-antitoxin system Phd/YefM family antitoxin [Marinomonas transparens]MBJ7540096.1 type II toxin-antitoxin system Phd/YefM family antitoxin [Marinomonas transparens]
MFNSSNIHTVTEFSRKPADHIKRLRESKSPELLTVNGKAAVVVQDAQSYERMAALADYADSILTIRKALDEDGQSLKSFTDKFEAKHGIKR